MHEKFQLIQSRRQFARLMGLVEEQEKALAEDPKPFLDQAYREVSKVRRLLDEIKAAAHGSDEMLRPFDPKEPLTYESIESKLLRRIRKVQKLISDFESQS